MWISILTLEQKLSEQGGGVTILSCIRGESDFSLQEGVTLCSQVTANPVTITTKNDIPVINVNMSVESLFGPQNGYQKVKKEHTKTVPKSSTDTVFGGASVLLQFSTEEK